MDNTHSKQAMGSNPDDKQSKTKTRSTDITDKYAQWDKLAKEMEKEEEEEDEGVEKLFQKIYRDANEDTKKAMVKSFTESQGTVLSTNWKEVKKDRVDVKPPEGSEYKRYDK